jgi:EAL domain-containing protein (putative c-di-GMP-specific phosphodiesterase class I)
MIDLRARAVAESNRPALASSTMRSDMALPNPQIDDVAAPTRAPGTDPRLIADLVVAVDRSNFRLEYQPIFGVADRTIHGVEALLRWGPWPGHERYSPAEFIPAAEHTGLIVPLGAWVLERALAELAGMGPTVRTSMNINVSARQLAEPNFVALVTSALHAADVAAERVDFEITETLAIHDFDRAARVVSEIRALGCRVGMDDFGTGYSSLTCLHRLQLDFIKIDQTFVQALCAQSCAKALVAATIALARELHLEVVAEGVETEQQLAQLAALGCQWAQGHYFARPQATVGDALACGAQAPAA